MVQKKGYKLIIFILVFFVIIVPSVSAIDTLPSSVEIPSIKLPTDQSKMSVQPSVISNVPPLPVAPQLSIQKPSIVTAPAETLFSESSSPNMANLNIVNDTFDSVSEPPVGWKFRGNLANTGEYDDGGIKPNGKLKWKTDVRVVSSSPVISNGVLYIGTRKQIHAMDMKTGNIIWVTSITSVGGSVCTPAISNGVVYFGTDTGEKFYALDAKSGDIIWERDMYAYVDSKPTVYEGFVYFGTRDKKLYCLNAKTGDIRWVFSTGGDVYSCPAISNGTLFISSNRDLFALNLHNGDLKWKTEIGVQPSSPVYHNGTIFIGCDSWFTTKKIMAINSLTGEIIWENKIGCNTDIAVSNGILFFGDGSFSDKVYALNCDTGAKIWEFKTGNTVISSPAVANDVVYIGSYDKLLYALDAKTGKQYWAFLTGGSISSSPLVSDGVVYIGSGDGKVYALGTGNTPTPDTASVSITSSPSKASIYIDELNTGKKTPATISGLTVGEHQVLLKKTGYSDFNQTVNLTLGKTTKLKAKLNRICTLVIYSKPSGASVWIDNSSTEKVTPFTNSTLAPGTHEVKLEKEGYNTFYKKVILKSGKKVTLNTKLTPI